MIQARIADVAVQIVGGDETFFNERFRDYMCDIRQPDLRMQMTRVETVPEPIGTPVLARDGFTVYREADGTISRYTIGKTSGQRLHRCRVSSDYTRWDYTLLENRRHPTLTLTNFEYLYSGEAFANYLATQGGVVMHGSAIAYKGKGIVFSAPCGTGKSTHAGLWKQYLGNQVVHVNDDKPAIRFVDDIPYIYGTPWSGKTDINANVSAPLQAIVFLAQAPYNRISKLSIAEAAMEIHYQTARPFYDEGLTLKIMEITDRLIQSVPIYRLECTISEEAVSLVRDTVFSKEG